MLSTKTPSLREQVPAAYKPRTRRLRREPGATKGGVLFTRSLRNSVAKATTSRPLLNKRIVINNLTTKQEQAARWVQHLREVLTHTPPGDPPYPSPADIALDIDTSPLTEEVRLSIKAMKCAKAAGIDAIHAEMLKASQTSSGRSRKRTRYLMTGAKIVQRWSHV